MSSDYLARVVRRKREEVGALHSWEAAFRQRAAEAPAPRPWEPALRDPERVVLIAEIKRQAPSVGELNTTLSPPGLATVYESAGAAAVSVLTDSDFAGELDDLRSARQAVSLPVLRKDFIIDPVQLYEARAAGADAVLLIVGALAGDRLGEMMAAADELGMGALLEVHDESELERALGIEARVIGINNRDLRTFEVDLETTERLAPLVPGDRVLVSESGISSPEQVRHLGGQGVDAVLVGSALVKHGDPSRLAAELASQPKEPRSS